VGPTEVSNVTILAETAVVIIQTKLSSSLCHLSRSDFSLFTGTCIKGVVWLVQL